MIIIYTVLGAKADVYSFSIWKNSCYRETRSSPPPEAEKRFVFVFHS
ncbi:hypothetical protein HMPREF3038_02892 [Akkermansia sp. KLE1797]|nr:hypothetical protein HMPREF3038_02892 [Akkermansia sp. KLE1797]KZA04068.1 hypothetical protein HMPREF1326_02265 [Akkermansia sp. KLE1605]